MTPCAHGRDPESSQKSPRAAGTAEGMTQGGNSMGSTHDSRSLGLREITDAELIEARERTDAGCRLVLPMLFDGLGPDPEADETERLTADAVPAIEIDDAVIGRAADKMAEFRAEVGRELHHLGKHAPRRIHIQAQAVVAECDEFLDSVRAHFMEQGS